MASDGLSFVTFRGRINGISKSHFENLRIEYDQMYARERILINEVRWSEAQGGSIVADFSLRLGEEDDIEELMREPFSRLAEHVSVDRHGLLLYTGRKLEDVAYVFFGHKKFEWKAFKIQFPDWWRDTRREMSEWDMLPGP